MYVERDIMARSHNIVSWKRNSTSFCVVGLHVAVNSKKVFIVAMEVQQ
jgi:hypothetical protein